MFLHAGIIGSDISSQAKYMQMVQAIDGHEPQETMEINLPEDRLVETVRHRLLRIQANVKRLADIPSIYCSVCSAIAKKRVQHVGGCPSTFNICFKCLGQHRSHGCANNWFKVSKNFCWKCWMPLFDIDGVEFHSKNKEDLIICKNEARDFVKPLAMCFFHNRIVVEKMLHPCNGDLSNYQRWLFSASQESVAGIGQVPNIVLLLEAILEQHMTSVLL